MREKGNHHSVANPAASPRRGLRPPAAGQSPRGALAQHRPLRGAPGGAALPPGGSGRSRTVQLRAAPLRGQSEGAWGWPPASNRCEESGQCKERGTSPESLRCRCCTPARVGRRGRQRARTLHTPQPQMQRTRAAKPAASPLRGHLVPRRTLPHVPWGKRLRSADSGRCWRTGGGRQRRQDLGPRPEGWGRGTGAAAASGESCPVPRAAAGARRGRRRGSSIGMCVCAPRRACALCGTARAACAALSAHRALSWGDPLPCPPIPLPRFPLHPRASSFPPCPPPSSPPPPRLLSPPPRGAPQPCPRAAPTRRRPAFPPPPYPPPSFP